MKTYAMMVLGCKVNDYEATYVRENLNKYYKEISFKDIADVYIIFTCCVTNVAESKTRKFIHSARKRNPNAYIVAVGCMSQIKGSSDDFKDVDLIVGSNQKDKIIDFILTSDKGNVVKEIGNEFEELFISSYPNKSRSFIKIEDGCNQFCSFCIIPYARGRERSAYHKKIIEEAKILSKINKEIVLTGIHIGRYNDGEFNLYLLLKELNNIDELETIRLSSIEITEIDDNIIDLFKKSNKFAPHLHIPVQSLNNEILKLMNRPYTIEEYINKIEYIRKEIPNISISTDLIVGFPNESDDIFEDILNKIKDINFSFIHVFPYSRKKGTVADNMNNHINNKIKKERVKKVIEIQKEISNNYKMKFLNKKVKVLIEKNDSEYSYGYSKEYIYIKINGIYKIGDIIDVKIYEISDEVIGNVVV